MAFIETIMIKMAVKGTEERKKKRYSGDDRKVQWLLNQGAI